MAMKRREFLYKTILLASTPLFGNEVVKYAKSITNATEPYQTITWVLNDIFPPSKNNPGIKQLNTIGYFHAVLNDKRIDDSEKKFIKNGTRWLNEESQEQFKSQYYSLNAKQREKLLRNISQKRWGDNWLWTLMNYMFESMFCDPVYGANLNQSGWKWLEYVPGHPRPKRVVV